MSTRERLEAEARELYPVLNWDAYHQEPVETYGYEECQQEAHVRAKTISADGPEIEAAAEDMRHVFADADFWLLKAVVRGAFSAAGFYVEENTDD